jgi:60 kDa SS-A/Ro ribonucleoprotein
MTYIYTHRDSHEASRAEERIPSMAYRELLSELSRLTELGVIAPESPATMLVVARLIDRSRIVRSGVTAVELRAALRTYLKQREPVYSVVKALDRAIETALENEGLENEGQSAANRPW